MEAEAPGSSGYHVKVILDREGIYTVWKYSPIPGLGTLLPTNEQF